MNEKDKQDWKCKMEPVYGAIAKGNFVMGFREGNAFKEDTVIREIMIGVLHDAETEITRLKAENKAILDRIEVFDKKIRGISNNGYPKPFLMKWYYKLMRELKNPPKSASRTRKLEEFPHKKKPLFDESREAKEEQD